MSSSEESDTNSDDDYTSVDECDSDSDYIGSDDCDSNDHCNDNPPHLYSSVHLHEVTPFKNWWIDDLTNEWWVDLVLSEDQQANEGLTSPIKTVRWNKISPSTRSKHVWNSIVVKHLRNIGDDMHSETMKESFIWMEDQS